MEYSKKTVNVMALAAKATQEFGDQQTEFRHVLLGIMQAGNSVTAQVLERHGISLHAVRARMPRNTGQNPSESQKILFLPHIIEEGAHEAKEMGSIEICPAHIVLAALEKSMAWFFLLDMAGVIWQNRAEIRQEIITGLATKEALKKV